MNGTYRIASSYAPMKPPPPPSVRVACHKQRGAPLEEFEAAGPIDAAIRQVREAGYPRAVVVVK